MANCWNCPHIEKIQRKFGVTTHCLLEPTHMDVSYYCYDKYKDEENTFCPLLKKKGKMNKNVRN